MRGKHSILFLVGARASGKTTVGRALALALGWRFVDTDLLLQEREGTTVAHMVEAHGWDYFRRKEGEYLRLAAEAQTVVATGGGMVLAEENRRFMREAGMVFYLCAPAAVLAARLAANPALSQRPSLTGRPLAGEVEEVLRQREALYRDAAHHVLDASLPPQELAAAVLAHIRECA